MLIVRTTPIDAELVSYLLFDGGALAVSEHAAGADIELHAGFPSIEMAETMRLRLGDRLVRIEAVDPDWIDTQRAGFSPLVVGPWRIRAPWHEPQTSDHSLIDTVIDPGAAFGHGRHPSTRLMLQMMSSLDLTNRRVLDVGTGTGVLAIAAALMGATVRAFDTSEVAVAQAAANAFANQVTDSITLIEDSVASSDEEGADLALINVTIDQHRLTSVHLQHVPLVVLSGLLVNQVDEAVSLYSSHSVVDRITSDEWVCLKLARDS